MLHETENKKKERELGILWKRKETFNLDKFRLAKAWV